MEMKVKSHPITKLFFLTMKYMCDIEYTYKNKNELKSIILAKKFKNDLGDMINEIDFNCNNLPYKVSCELPNAKAIGLLK